MTIQILLLALFPILGKADVNMKDASFTHRQNDFGHSFMSRTYSSRSLWNGVFGFGWCAGFEKHLDVTIGKLKHCDREIEASVKAKGPIWVVTKKRKIFETYNFRGQLMQIKDSKGLIWDLSYDSQGRLSRIQSERFVYTFVYPAYQLSRIESSKDPPAKYLFNGPLLVQSLSASGTSKYTYDDLQNLTQVELPLQAPVQIDYKKDLDQVRQVKIGNCQQDFSFQKMTNTKFKSIATTRCPASVMRQQVFTFTARPSKTGKWKVSGETSNESLSLP